jgi:hypothetical protein
MTIREDLLVVSATVEGNVLVKGAIVTIKMTPGEARTLAAQLVVTAGRADRILELKCAADDGDSWALEKPIVKSKAG